MAQVSCVLGNVSLGDEEEEEKGRDKRYQYFLKNAFHFT